MDGVVCGECTGGETVAPRAPSAIVIPNAVRDLHLPVGRSGLSSPESGVYIERHDAGIAQLVEHNLAKVGVAGSSPVSRSVRSRRGSDQRALPL